MSKKIRFTAAEFVSTKWDSAEDKAKFANWLAQFLLDGCPEKSWAQTKYRKLCQMFMFIAHYNANGFWEERFASSAARAETVRQMVHSGCFGDPTCTWSDVERAIRKFVLEERLDERYHNEHLKDVETRERKQLADLKTKYPDR